MSLSLVTLNIEGDKHISRWLPVMKQLRPDVVCLQELYQADCEMIATELEMEYQFATTTKMEKENGYNMSLRGNWGVGLFSKQPPKNVTTEYYSEENELRVFQEPNDPRRVVITAEIEQDNQRYRVATTHFTWSPAGNTTELQKEDFSRLKKVLAKYPDLILCGDFNAPRGGELFGSFEKLYKDNVPPEVTTTIDSSLHYAGHLNLQFVVDSIFTTKQYQVTEITVLEKVSDHKGLYAVIEKNL